MCVWGFSYLQWLVLYSCNLQLAKGRLLTLGSCPHTSVENIVFLFLVETVENRLNKNFNLST